MQKLRSFFPKVKVNLRYCFQSALFPAGQQLSAGVENDLTGGSSIPTDTIVKRPREKAAALQVSSA